MDNIIPKLRAVVGDAAVLSEPDELLVYECDGLPQHKYLPRAVVFPSSTEQTSAVMRLLAAENIPFTPRGAGTGLSGGALSLDRGVVIELARMRKILKVDEANRLAVVQPGVVNSHVSRAVAHLGLHYVPDPSSQPTCTIGGNIAENAGGIHCLKYGTTTDHVLGVRVVLAGGDVVDLGGGGTEKPGYDLLGIFVGSEGTFGIATEATLRLVPIPPAIRTMLAEFAEVNDASHAVSAIIAAGVMPAALEMMDREIIHAVEASVFAAGLPLDAGAALLIELDGLEAGLDEEAERVKTICLQYGARDCRSARDENERKKLWAARKGAFGAIGRIAPDSMIQDAVVPRSRLPEVLDGVFRIAGKYQLRIANVFHAGDGNLHPLICFDSRSVAEVRNVKEAGRELMETCVRAGGSITGEHGVGFDKRELLSLIFSEADMETMLRVRAAFDPTGLCNPGKIIPMLRGCGEARAIVSPGNATLPMPEPTSSRAGDLLGPRASRPHLSPNSTFESTRSQQQPGGREARGPGKSLASGGVAQQLARLIGEENISVASSLSSTPHIVSPGSVAEVSEVMKLASSYGWRVLPAGAMTWLLRLEPADIIVSTQRLNRIINHEPADLIAVTEAGVTLKDFNDTLNQKGQWLPLDPPDDERATIGGVVATGLGGAQQFGYGPPRKHVIGMKIVLADGSLIKVGGRVVKNVAGYDLCKLFTGSLGTLGIIVEVNFKLRPMPFETRTVTALGQREQLISASQRIIASRLFPVAIELVSQPIAKAAGWSDENNNCLLIRFAGLRSGVNYQATQAIEILRGEAHRPPEQSAGDDSRVWQSIAKLPSLFCDDLVWRVGLRPADVPTFLASVDQKNDSTAEEPIWQASVGEGRIRVVERHIGNTNTSAETMRETLSRLESFKEQSRNLGGSLVIEHAPTEIRDRINSAGTPDSSQGIMQRIKQQLDPDGIFPSLSN